MAYHDQVAAHTTAIYTDASWMDNKSKGVGVGMAVLAGCNAEPTYLTKANSGNQITVYNGEVDAIARAFELLTQLNPPPPKIHVFSDCQAAVQRISHPSDNPGQECQIRSFKAAKQALAQHGTAITLCWISSHTGDIPGNDVADELAKQGSLLPNTQGHTSWAFWRSKAREGVRKQWERQAKKKNTPYMERFGWKAAGGPDMPPNTSRKIHRARSSNKNTELEAQMARAAQFRRRSK